MIIRRIHTVDGLPMSSEELDTYYAWVDDILKIFTTIADEQIYIETPEPIVMYK